MDTPYAAWANRRQGMMPPDPGGTFGACGFLSGKEDTMKLTPLIDRLRDNALTFQGITRSVPTEMARWKPSPEQWSILEVVNHLADEEVSDFRTRLDLTLHRPDEAWPAIDPPEWAVERRYNDRDLPESLERFLLEREKSVAWLSRLSSPDWGRAHQHSRFGAIRAGDLMTSWVAHDFMHIRQINRVHYQYLTQELSPYPTRYAGDW